MAFNLKQKLSSKLKPSAEVVEGHLILSLPNAIEPVVWRMALEKIGTAVFETNIDKKNQTTSLVLKPKKGTSETIAVFSQQQEAVDALMLTSKAMQQSSHSTNDNKSNDGAIHSPIQTKGEGMKWIIALLGAICVIAIYAYMTTLIPTTAIVGEGSTSASAQTADPQSATGVPVSADDFLSGF